MVKGFVRLKNQKTSFQPLKRPLAKPKANYGNGAMYIERVIYPARHIEVQILGDEHGKCDSLGEQDCSLQRNKPKVLEESPSIAQSEKRCVMKSVRLLFELQSLLVMKMQGPLSFFLMKPVVNSILWR